jgi:hypothetical protein
VHAKVQLWTRQFEHLRSTENRASNFHGSTVGQHRQTSMGKKGGLVRLLTSGLVGGHGVAGWVAAMARGSRSA